VVIGTIDEEGMARTAEKKFAIAQRLSPSRIRYPTIFFDPLALPISTGIEEDRAMVALRLQPSAACVKNCPVVTLFWEFPIFPSA